MIGFIKNWLKSKINEEVKKEYKKVPTQTERKPKANWITRDEDIEGLENEHKAYEIESDILDLCFGGLRPDQEDCPPLIIYKYKKLLEIANEESLVRTTNNLGMFLSEQQQQDFMNKVSQLKEYKEYRLKKRINKLNEDF